MFLRDFPGGLVVKILHFHCWGHEFHPLSGNEDPIHYAVQPKRKKKKHELKKKKKEKQFLL